jgi:hypothetical protein
MKIVPVLLVASLAANLGLAYVYTTAQRSRSESKAPSVTAAKIPRHALGPEGLPSVSGVATNANAGGGATGETIPGKRPWTEIETEDLAELARRLKAEGFSPREVRSILAAKISEKYDLNGFKRGLPYWQSEFPNYADPKVQAMQAESQALYRKFVFGPDHILDDPEQLAMARQQYGPLPPDKLQSIARIEADYNELASNRGRSMGTDPAAEWAAFEALQKAKDQKIREALSPEEYAEYELRGSATARSLRSQLETFQPSEEEYKAIFAIEKSFRDRLVDQTLSAETRRTLEAERLAQVAATLGPERADDYQEATQNGRDQTARVVAALGLPARVGGQVRAMQKDFTERAAVIRSDAQLAAADRTAQLNALAQEARSHLTATLGPDGFDAYNGLKGEWIRAIEVK